MKRVLCIRFANWPIQCLRHHLREIASTSTSLAIHTAPPIPVDDRQKKSSLDEDTRFIRKLFPAAQGGPAIVAVSPDAWAKGVRPGMPLAEARSMAQPIAVNVTRRRPSKSESATTAPSVEFHEWQPERDRKVLKSVAELTRRYAPIVGLDDVPLPDSLLLDITGCGPLFGGEAGLAESLLRDLRQAGWSCRIAVAQTVSAVWALTHAEFARRPDANRANLDRRRPHRSVSESMLHELPIQIVPQGQHLAEINGLPVSASRLDLNDLEILSHLGIRSIGQLLGLPREDLPARLSANAILRIQQLSETIDEPIEPLPEANPIAATWSSDEPACGLIDVRHILQFLTDQIAEQLVRRRMACSSLSCVFKCNDGSLVPLNGSVVKPTQSSELLHEVLCLRVETEGTLFALEDTLFASGESGGDAAVSEEDMKSRLAGKVASLDSQPFSVASMTASVAPIPVARQRDLFSPAEHIVPQEELATLITRLSGRLGASSVLTVRGHADPRPEFSQLCEPILPQDPSSVRQSTLDTSLRRLIEPAGSTAIDSPAMVPRPLRLLANPQPIFSSAVGKHFPTEVIVAGKTLLLAEFSAAERIQTAWWTDQPCHRDYYQATTRSGSRLWLFRELQSNQWFLHGVFD